MKIIELKSSNIKRLKAVELQIDENQNLIMITGKNGQGKSSVLDSIWYALGGSKNIADKPIREGEEKAEVEITLQGENGSHVVRRTFTEKGSYLTITNSDGSKFSNPQTFLDFIVNKLSFDPLEFSRMDSKQQIEQLKSVLKLDFTELDKKKSELIEERLLTGREEKNYPHFTDEKLFEGAKEEAAQQLLNTADLMQKLDSIQTQHNAYVKYTEFVTSTKDRIKELKTEIESLEKRLSDNPPVEDAKEDIEDLKKRINNADSVNESIRSAQKKVTEHDKYQELHDKYESLSKQIIDIEAKKSKQLSEAKLPIKGLSWGEDKVLYNGVPYNQISSAEQLRVSMAIAMAANPKLRILQIRDGSLLDKDNLKIVSEMLKDNDFQAFIERVDDSGKVGIVIEDGSIKTINKDSE